MADTPIVIGQVWRYRDEREDRNVEVIAIENNLESGFVMTANTETRRRSRIRPAVLRAHYRLLEENTDA